ncbi:MULTISPECIES: DUF6415 family natural product biosynthesis protein [unclassified Streptomyces]|uniref:DUF6415 family natural product biosynthesis protein n=1 Tax=unclassified Streptomyces TaxID=2593676 RepID=UPI0020C6D1F5|nr:MULTISPECIES: DUF6415 family natural product biosynthesis protein [unclassified Streptomyces]
MALSHTSPRRSVISAGGTPAGGGPVTSSRDLVASATETINLVLDEGSPLPETDQDVTDLVRRLRGHIMQLADASLPGRTLDHAREVSGTNIPEGYVPSRVYLRQLALVTHALVAEHTTHLSRRGRLLDRPGPWGRWRPSRIALRRAVVAVAVILLIIVSSVPN